MSTYTAEQLVAIGGSEWTKNGKRRVYFNDLAALYGLELTRYHTGNIASATLDGREISNNSAAAICRKLSGASVWYDMSDGKFYGRIEQAMFDTILANIKSRLEAINA